MSLNQNLTLNYDDTSYSGQQDINSTLQAILEKVFPQQINLNDKDSSWFDRFQATSAKPIYFDFSDASTYKYVDTPYVDLTNFNSIDLTYNTSRACYTLVTLIDRNSQSTTLLPVTTLNTGTLSKSLDISNYSGEYMVRLCVYTSAQQTNAQTTLSTAVIK